MELICHATYMTNVHGYVMAYVIGYVMGISMLGQTFADITDN